MIRVKDETKHYNSFKDFALACGLKPARPMNPKKAETMKVAFEKKHKCKACHQPMTLVTGNILVCKNENCNGIKKERTDKEGLVHVYYEPSFELLPKKEERIASKIF